MGPAELPRARRRSVVRRTGRRLGAADAWLLRRAVSARTSETDRIMLGASRAANHSKLWMAVALALAVHGGTRGRRAATRGLLGIAITSAGVNGPLKLILRRKRPAAVLGGRPSLVRMPESFSFPSGHSASAFAFATAVAREWPAAGVPVAAAAGVVAYSRVHNGVHFPGDVVVGAGLGVAAGAVAGLLLRDDRSIQLPPGERADLPRDAVLLTSPSAGAADALDAVKAAMQQAGIRVVEEIPVENKEKLADIVAMPTETRPLLVAAGGDGTVGAAADEFAGTRAIIGILPLGTSNDVARSLGIPADPIAAVDVLVNGVVRSIDAGQVIVRGEPPHHFVHAATVGFNVHFAQLATKSSLRRRFGRFTYAVAAVKAMQQHTAFDCELTCDGTTEKLRLVQLSIVNAPVFGGSLDLRVPGARMDDRSLVVIAVEEGSPLRLVFGALVAAVGRRREAPGVRALRTKELTVHVDRPLDVALDGEITARLPADFVVAADALRVVTPHLRDNRV